MSPILYCPPEQSSSSDVGSETTNHRSSCPDQTSLKTHLDDWDSPRLWKSMFADPTFETLSFISSDMPEKSALSPKASVIPNPLSVSSREASAEMENLGRNRSTDLRGRGRLVITYAVMMHSCCCCNMSMTTMRVRTLMHLHPPKLVMPVLDEVLVDAGLHFLHLSFIRKNDDHGGAPLVRQLDDRSVVVIVMIVVIATQPLHHVHLNFGVFVHMKVCLVCQVTIEGFLPLSCKTKDRERDAQLV